ncbi:MAG: diacylglycerol kinase family lipid kinase [bacterium]|nr:diacylglycerol kinase family lipid kinase [bacterium]
MRKKVLVIANPVADRRKTERIIPFIREILIKKKIDFRLYITDRPLHATDLAREGKKHYTDIVSVGGDGTLNEVLNGLGPCSCTLGVVSTGSGNDFAKNFRHGMGIEEQMTAALEGEVRKIDAGLCNDRYFINGVGIGFDGKVVEEMMKEGKVFKGHAGYLYVVLKCILSYREPVMTIRVNKEVIQEKVFLIDVANGTTFGGGFKLTPDARVDDGELDVCWIKAMGILGRYINMPKVTRGEHVHLDVVRMMRIKAITIESNEDTVAHMDGEFIGSGPFHIKVLPGFIRIRGKWR